jgi:tetratricopeptide (TPR) repeat protein
MKKFFISTLVILISIASSAQMGKVTSALAYMDQGLLDKAKEALDQAFSNDKSKDNPKTYFAKGRFCQEVFRTENPKFKTLIANPLVEAYAAYEKALELDTKGNMKKQMSLNNTFLSLGNDFINQGVQKFEAKDYEGALNAFEYDIKVGSSELYAGVIDTGIYFNAGLSAYNANLYEKAIPHFRKCIDLKYEGTTTYQLLYNCYHNLNDMDNAEKVLEEAFEAYPSDKDIMMLLVDFYINNDKLDKAASYIQMAKEKNPDDFALYWAEGVIYMKQEKYDQAIATLTKSVELKGDQYDTQFNLGVCYYNKAVELFQAANEIMDVDKYNVAVADANKVFVKAIPYFERAEQLKPDDTDALRNLKELYFRLRTTNPDYENKYNDIIKRLGGS